MDKNPRLLYLGFAFPPGLRALHPGINPAGNAFETQMVLALREHFEIRSVGLLPISVDKLPGETDPQSGVAHELLLVEKKPELWHRWKSYSRLRRQYRQWQAKGWQPEAILAYNLSPVYNKFIRWLTGQKNRPKLALLLLDSTQLGKKLSSWKKFRYRLKPFNNLEAEMLGKFDACVGLSINVQQYVKELGVPFLWMPGACTPERAQLDANAVEEKAGPLSFCYFGALAPHTGIVELAELFLALPGDSELHISGYGKQSEEIAALAKSSPRLHFHGLLNSPDDCLVMGRSFDVLINPRPPGFGNENNVASKLFDYALCGRAVIVPRLSGTDEVMGPSAFYFEMANYRENLKTAIQTAMNCSRAELNRRGAEIQRRVTTEYNWRRQAGRMAQFIKGNQAAG